MPAYQNNPFSHVQLLQKGAPAYLIGSFSQQVGKTKLAVVTDAIASNVATVVGAYLGGPLPAVGSLISIINSANSSGAFNVNRVAITAASFNNTTNQMTVSFALTGTNQAATADTGTVIIEPAPVGESVTASGFTSIPVVVQAPEGDSQFTVPFSYTSGPTQTAATATLQVAIDANSGEWTNTATKVTKTGASTYNPGPVVEATLERGYAYRIAVTSVTGTDLAVGKLG